MKNNHLFFGLFVGSFNPPTKAHLQIARDLLENKYLHQISFLPVNSQKENLASLTNRHEMLKLGIKNNKQLNILNIYDYSKDGFFDIFVLKKIDNITHLIMGSDLFLKLKTFKNYEEILKNYYLIIILRDNLNILKEIESNYASYQDKFIIINKTYSISSTMARKSLDKQDNLTYLEKEILAYIKNNNLYN